MPAITTDDTAPRRGHPHLWLGVRIVFLIEVSVLLEARPSP
jgi:hypothetical protein